MPLLEEALAGHAPFQALVEQHAQAVMTRTREQLAAVGVKISLHRPAARKDTLALAA